MVFAFVRVHLTNDGISQAPSPVVRTKLNRVAQYSAGSGGGSSLKFAVKLPPFVETGYFPYSLIKPDRNLSSTSMFLSLDVEIARVSLLFGSIATHNQINSEPTLIGISSTMYSIIFFYCRVSFGGCIFKSISELLHDFS